VSTDHSFVENLLSGLCLEGIMGQSYRELIAWQKAMDFVMKVYAVTKTFPRDEVYALAGQLRKAAVFVPTNIAEGQARYTAQEFHFFLGRARGSLVEAETELLIAQNLGYISTERAQKMLDQAAELGRVLNGLAASIKPAA
jgi:four helix bundle protein